MLEVKTVSPRHKQHAIVFVSLFGKTHAFKLSHTLFAHGVDLVAWRAWHGRRRRGFVRRCRVTCRRVRRASASHLAARTS